MERVGQSRTSLIGAQPLLVALIAVLFSGVLIRLLWGFTIDDALITLRYAQNLKAGLGYRFNLADPISDGVTPIPWLCILVPFGGLDTASLLTVARSLGALSVTIAAAAFVARASDWQTAFSRALLSLLPVPVCMHAGSGMETGLATALGFATLTVFPSPHWTPVLCGLAASVRPELLPWAWTLSLLTQRNIGAALRATAVCLTPMLLICGVRYHLFNTISPLALAAKPSDLSFGTRYAAAAALYTVVPVLAAVAVFVPSTRKREARIALAAGLVHLVALAMVGGDWMPFARLLAPVLPTFALVAAIPKVRWYQALASLAVLTMVYTQTKAYPARRVLADRVQVARDVAPYLTQTTATLDVGWPTLTAPREAILLDLSGVTNPDIAYLPGGHTSKRVPDTYLLRADTLLVYAVRSEGADFAGSTFPRTLEARMAHSETIARHFEPVHWAPLVGTTGYWVLQRRLPAP